MIAFLSTAICLSSAGSILRANSGGMGVACVAGETAEAVPAKEAACVNKQTRQIKNTARSNHHTRRNFIGESYLQLGEVAKVRVIGRFL